MHGLIIGKFYPPHRGHEYLLHFAQNWVDKLTVLVCSLQEETISGVLRTEWVSEMCPTAHVIHVDDQNPQEPQEHPDFWSIWINTIRTRIPVGPDYVFSS